MHGSRKSSQGGGGEGPTKFYHFYHTLMHSGDRFSRNKATLCYMEDTPTIKSQLYCSSHYLSVSPDKSKYISQETKFCNSDSSKTGLSACVSNFFIAETTIMDLIF